MEWTEQGIVLNVRTHGEASAIAEVLSERRGRWSGLVRGGTEAAFGQHGSQEFNVEKLLNERPEYFVFNGAVGALSKLHPLEAKVGETVRIFFGVGGPNFTSAFHVIGEMFDKVYNLGGVLSEPLKGIQTVTVPPGGAVITEFKIDVPGNYILVDHALSRLERGLVGICTSKDRRSPKSMMARSCPGEDIRRRWTDRHRRTKDPKENAVANVGLTGRTPPTAHTRRLTTLVPPAVITLIRPAGRPSTNSL